MSVNYDNIPAELKALKQWVCYKSISLPDGRKSKEPRNPKNGYGAKANDPNTWTDFDTALKGVEKWRLDGIGFEFANGYVGIDLDHVLEDGRFINPAAEDIFNQIDSYAELSPSGTGIHIICKGFLPEDAGTRKDLPGQKYPNDPDPLKKQGLEMYARGRFFTVTGDVFRGRTEIRDCSAAAYAVHARFIGKREQTSHVSTDMSDAYQVKDSDADLLRKAASAANGYLFRKLWNGDISDYPSHSEADMALAKILIYWCNGDIDRADSLFRQSGLMRDKWDERRHDSTYGRVTLENALRDYDPYTGPSRSTAAEDFGGRNEWQQNGQNLAAAIESVASSMPTPNNPHPDSALAYLKGTFEGDIKKFMTFKDRRTGFENLDRETTGLYPGLYVIGAISSLGKTTFCSQMADNLAEAGEKVLYFSVEQSRMEMITKSISRITAKNDLRDNMNPVTGKPREFGDTEKAVPAINIRRGHITAAVKQAVKDYSQFAGNVDIVECGFGVTFEYIRDYITKYIEATGEKPVVFIDYLQVLKTADQRLSKQDRMDTIVTGLKKMQVDNDLVVIVISSLNRQNYLSPVDFESFKESGGIEYTADVVWGLQLQIMRSDEIFLKDTKIIEKRKKVSTAKRAIPRKVELCCLKNRYGVASYYCAFQYDPRYDYFVEDLGFSPLNEDDIPFENEEEML